MQEQELLPRLAEAMMIGVFGYLAHSVHRFNQKIPEVLAKIGNLGDTVKDHEQRIRDIEAIDHPTH